MARYLGGLSWADLGKRLMHEITTGRIFDEAAKMAFYFLLALFPFLIFLLSIVGLVASASGAQHELVHWLTQAMPQSASSMVRNVLEQTARSSGSGKLSFGIILAVWTASSGMVAVIDGLNVAFDIHEERTWVRKRITAIWLILAMSIFMLLAMGIILFGGWVLGQLGSGAGMSSTVADVWRVVQWPLAIVLVMLAFALVYRFAPDKADLKFKWVTPGAVVGVVLWLAASFGFRIYLAHFNSYASTYGSLGAVIILMLWFYITAIAILLGGEVDSEIEQAAKAHSD